jgi:hypothetical protein
VKEKDIQEKSKPSKIIKRKERKSLFVNRNVATLSSYSGILVRQRYTLRQNITFAVIQEKNLY